MSRRLATTRRLRTLDARGVPVAAAGLRGVLAAARGLDLRAVRSGALARRALTPQVLTALVVGCLLAGAASALDERGDRLAAGGAPVEPVALGPSPASSVDAWATAVAVELGSRAQSAPAEPTLALVVPGTSWTPADAADAFAGVPLLEPVLAVVRAPGKAEREVGVRVLPGDLAEQTGLACACAAGLLVRAPLGELALLAEEPGVLAVQPAPRGTRDASTVRLRVPVLP